MLHHYWGVTVLVAPPDASFHGMTVAQVRTSTPRQARTDLWLKASFNSLIQGTDTLQFWSLLGFSTNYYAKFSEVPITHGYLHLLPKGNTSKIQQPNELLLLNQSTLLTHPTKR